MLLFGLILRKLELSEYLLITYRFQVPYFQIKLAFVCDLSFKNIQILAK